MATARFLQLFLDLSQRKNREDLKLSPQQVGLSNRLEQLARDVIKASLSVTWTTRLLRLRTFWRSGFRIAANDCANALSHTLRRCSLRAS